MTVRLLLLCLLLAPVGGMAKEVTFPALSGRVVDNAAILSPAAETRIDAQLARHEQATGEQLAVVTLPSLQGLEIEEYGYRLGRHWGIGQKGKDNGALLIVAPKERAVRIEVGYGLEERLTDAASSMIVSRAILPYFKQGQMEQGIESGVQGILFVLNPAQEAQPPALARAKPQETGLLDLIMPFVMFFLFYRLLVRRMGRGGALLGTAMLLSGGHHRSGFGGGGGFRGGGGSFGGGGASGRW